jgi:hypothetical protein
MASSSLLFDEYFTAADPRFLAELLGSTQAKKLRAFAERWYADARPGLDGAASGPIPRTPAASFAREMLLAYLDDGCDRHHHRPLVKSLFKRAEKAGDDEAMAHFLAAFDRFPRRRMGKAWRYDPATQTSGYEPTLIRDKSFPARLGAKENRAPRFSLRTRRYLCRRAFRYFRGVARKDPARYGRAIRAALVLYQDAHLEKPEQLLDAWSLLDVLYWGSPVIVRDPRGVKVAEGRSLAELEPAPFAEKAWQGVFDEVFALLTTAGSRTVRAFAMALLRRDYDGELRGLPLIRVRGLLRSPHDEVQAFGAELLRTATGVHNLSVEEWLAMLRIDNPIALPLLCEMVEKTVSPGRLSLAQCVELACARPAPVAELGLRWAKQKPIDDAAALSAALGVAAAGAPRVRAEACAWVAELIGASAFAAPEHLRVLCDARFADARAAGLALVEKDARFRESTVIWAALAESPYDDVRTFLVAHLASRRAVFAPETLRHVWASTLLAVHRGGRAKRAALAQIAARVARHPGEAESLVPLLAIALRSVRAPERRAALAAVASAAVREPAVARAVERFVPELRIEQGALA